MVLQNDLGRAAQCRAYRSELDQNLRTVTTVFHHALHRFEMPDGTGKAIDDGLGLRMDMPVGMCVLMLTCFLVIVRQRVAVNNAVAVIVFD